MGYFGHWMDAHRPPVQPPDLAPCVPYPFLLSGLPCFKIKQPSEAEQGSWEELCPTSARTFLVLAPLCSEC